jgi:hypothetical protein
MPGSRATTRLHWGQMQFVGGPPGPKFPIPRLFPAQPFLSTPAEHLPFLKPNRTVASTVYVFVLSLYDCMNECVIIRSDQLFSPCIQFIDTQNRGGNESAHSRQPAGYGNASGRARGAGRRRDREIGQCGIQTMFAGYPALLCRHLCRSW